MIKLDKKIVGYKVKNQDEIRIVSPEEVKNIKPEEKEQEKEAEALVCFLRSAFSDSFSEY